MQEQELLTQWQH